MKLYNSTFVLLLLLLSINLNSIFVKGNGYSGIQPTVQNLFLNIVPYSDGGCSSIPKGIGYSLVVGQCLNDIGNFLSIDQDYDYQSWFFNVTYDSEQELSIIGLKYNQQNCSGQFESQYISSTGCSLSPVIASFNGTFKGYTNSYSSATLTKSPTYFDNAIVYSVYSGSGSESSSDGRESSNSISHECTTNNFLYATIISSGLELDYVNPAGIQTTYNCVHSTPAINYCNYGSCTTVTAQMPCSFNKQTNYYNFNHCSR